MPDQLGLLHFVRLAKNRDIFIYIIGIYFHRKTTWDVFPYMNVEKSNFFLKKKKKEGGKKTPKQQNQNTMKLTTGRRGGGEVARARFQVTRNPGQCKSQAPALWAVTQPCLERLGGRGCLKVLWGPSWDARQVGLLFSSPQLACSSSARVQQSRGGSGSRHRGGRCGSQHSSSW